MKKFSILLLALAFAVAFAAPVMAAHIGDAGTATAPGDGALDIGGKYEFDGEYQDWGDFGSDMFFDDDFELVLKISKGAVSATVDLEISDDGEFDGSDENDTSVFFDTNGHNIERSGDLVDNYFITWKATDALSFKIGEYAVHWGRKVAIYNAGGHNVGVTYTTDPVDINFWYCKVEEDQNGDDEDADIDEYVFGFNVKKTPFTKLGIYYAMYAQAEDIGVADGGAPGDSVSESLLGIDWAIPVGPVALAGEIASLGGDNWDGTMYLVEAGLKDLVGFDFNVNLFMSDENWLPVIDNDYAPLEWYFDDINDDGYNTTALWVDASYAVNDKLTVGGALAPFINSTDEDFGPESWGMEIDVNAEYKFAPNVKGNAALGYFAGDEDAIDETLMSLWYRLTFTF